MPPSLVGIWLAQDNISFGEKCLLTILPGGRTIQFATSVSKPRPVDPVWRLWHSGPDSGPIRFRLWPSSPGWQGQIEWDAEGFTMSLEIGELSTKCRCVPADPASLPDWYPELMDYHLRRMDEVEAEKKTPSPDLP